MAFAGIHVEAGFAGVRGANDTIQSILQKRVWSETVAAPGTTVGSAPQSGQGSGQMILRISAQADSYIAIGANPNAAANPRILIRAGERLDEPCEPGDKVAFILVP